MQSMLHCILYHINSQGRTQDLVCGLQFGVRHHYPWNPLLEAHPAQSGHIHQLVDCTRPDWEEAGSEPVKHASLVWSRTVTSLHKTTSVVRNNPVTPSQLNILNNTVSTVDTYRFLDPTISWDLKWISHVDTIRKKTQERLYFPRRIKKFNLSQELLITFYTSINQFLVHTYITVWFGSATK